MTNFMKIGHKMWPVDRGHLYRYCRCVYTVLKKMFKTCSEDAHFKVPGLCLTMLTTWIATFSLKRRQLRQSLLRNRLRWNFTKKDITNFPRINRLEQMSDENTHMYAWCTVYVSFSWQASSTTNNKLNDAASICRCRLNNCTKLFSYNATVFTSYTVLACVMLTSFPLSLSCSTGKHHFIHQPKLDETWWPNIWHCSNYSISPKPLGF